MKKIISSIMLFAAAATAFVSCQKQEVSVSESSREVTLTFASEKPAFDDDTRTEWTGETIKWSAGDRISVAYTVDGVWQNASGDASDDAKLYKSDVLSEAAETAQFNVSTSFKGAAEGKHVFYGVYPAPSSTDFSNAPVAILTVPVFQTPKAASFDGSADLMTGVSVGEYTARPATGETVSMKWTRLVAHADITLKAINGVVTGERVASITLTAQENANIVGQQKVNILTNEIVNDNAAANVLELNGGNLTVDANGNVEFWACILPETVTSLTVVLETDKATYTREITGISKTFKQNARNTLAIKMDSATRVAKDAESWTLVTPGEDLAEGTYALVVSTDSKTGALVSSNGSSAAPTFETSISVEGNLLYGVTDVMKFDLSGTAGNYVLSVAGDSGKSLYCTATNNGVRVGTNTNKTWTISVHQSNADAFEFKHNGTSRYLGVYNNQDWRCYTSPTATNYTNGSGSSQIYLYKRVSGTVAPDTTPKLEVDETTIELPPAASNGTIAVTAKNLASVQARALVQKDAQEESDWLSAEYAEGVVTYTASANEDEKERTAYIEVYALDADGNELVKYVEVIQEAYVDPSVVVRKTIAEFKALADGSTAIYELEGRISQIAAAYSEQYDNISFYIVDEAGDEIQIYRMSCVGVTDPGAAITVGDRIVVRGTKGSYGGQSQMAAGGQYVTHEDGSCTPVIVCQDNTVTITADAGATIYYTTNGQTPTVNDAEYAGPFPISSTLTVKAIAVEDGKLHSLVATEECSFIDSSTAQPIEATLSFADKAQRTEFTTSKQVWEQNGIVLTNDKAASTSNVADYANPARFYKSSKITIEAPGNITKIVFDCNSSSYATALKSSITSGGTVSVNSDKVTVVLTDPATSFVIASLSGGQVRMDGLTVTYEN